MSGYDLSVLWPSSLFACLSHSNSHTKKKAHVRTQTTLKNNFIYRWAEEKKKKICRNVIMCVELSVFIIPSLLSDGNDLSVTNCVDLNRGPFGEPFHHLHSTSSNSHDLMRCRMPEICCLCFLFSPSTLSHQQQQGSITGRSGWHELLEQGGELAVETGLLCTFFSWKKWLFCFVFLFFLQSFKV